MTTPILAGRSGGGGSRPRIPRPRTSTRPRTGSSTRPTVNNHTTVIHNHVYAPTRVYGGRTYAYRSGGWGYGYYGYHPYFAHWYGYPVYYGNPVHWSGWDWPLALAIVGVLGVGGWLLARTLR